MILLFILIAIASFAVHSSLSRKMKKYSQMPIYGNLTGAEIARKMLADNGIYNVQITQIKGQLTDHYNPTQLTVNLSEGVYNGTSIASAAVAAHECGHAIQHATQYSMLKLRSNLIPAVDFASKTIPWILLGGIILLGVFPPLLFVAIILYAITTLFSFVTLPVEIDASKRAIAWLKNSGMTDEQTAYYATDALKAAAYTYVVAALSSLITLFYYILIFMGRRD